MHLIVAVLVLYAQLFNVTVLCNPSDPRTPVKKFQNALVQQSLQTILTSIEERLRNLDNVYSTQYSPSVEGRLEHYNRKLESVEAKISRLEALVSSEAEKLTENISAKSFKDDIANEHVLRKIDYAYDRLSHRLIFAEGKMEMAERKLDEKLSMVLSKLDKMEENFSARDHDVQTDLADVIATVEDVKIQMDGFEDKIENITKSISGVQHAESKYPHSDGIFGFTAHRDSTRTLSKEIREHFEILSNKITGFHESSWKTYDQLQATLRSISLVANQTRYEIQSGLRSLTIEVGRMAGHTNFGNSSKNTEKLDQLQDKIENKLEHVMMAQNMFLESCYRVQKDEAQLESKIGEVLEKLLETFLQKTALEPKDLRKVEQMLISHDQHMRRAFDRLVDEKMFKDGMSGLANQIGSLLSLIEGEGNVNEVITHRLDQILTAIKDVQSLFFDINGNIKQLSNDQNGNYEKLRLVTEKLESIHVANVGYGGNCNSLLKPINEIHQLLLNVMAMYENSNVGGEFPETNISNAANTTISNVTEETQTRDPALVQLINEIFNPANVNQTENISINATSNINETVNGSPVDMAEYPAIDIRAQESVNSQFLPILDSIDGDATTTNVRDVPSDMVVIDNAARDDVGKIKRAVNMNNLGNTQYGKIIKSQSFEANKN